MQESVLHELVAQGTAIVHAYDGLDALRKLVDHTDVDLVLLDINMPVLNGLAFLEQKQRTQYAAIPVIVLSAEGDDASEVQHALSHGARCVLPKPFSLSAFMNCLRFVRG